LPQATQNPPEVAQAPVPEPTPSPAPAKPAKQATPKNRTNVHRREPIPAEQPLIDKDVQQQIFASLGISEQEAKARFGFFLDALEFGTPPHGGIALGLDRIVMLLAGAPNMREVVAFPKTAKAIDLMADAPTTVTEQQLKELHIRVVVKS